MFFELKTGMIIDKLYIIKLGNRNSKKTNIKKYKINIIWLITHYQIN